MATKIRKAVSLTTDLYELVNKSMVHKSLSFNTIVTNALERYFEPNKQKDVSIPTLLSIYKDKLTGKTGTVISTTVISDELEIVLLIPNGKYFVAEPLIIRKPLTEFL